MDEQVIPLGVGLGTTALALGGYLYLRKMKKQFRKFVLRYEEIKGRFE